MKLVLAIIHDDDANNVMSKLRKDGHAVTKLATTGGFLRSGNTTLIIGVEDEKLEEVLTIFRTTCETRMERTVIDSSFGGTAMGGVSVPIDVKIGGATIFVLDVEQFYKI